MKKTIFLASAGFVLTAAAGFAAHKYLGSGNVPRPVPPVQAQYDRNVGMRRGGREFENRGFGRGIEAIAEKFGMTAEELRSQLGTKTILEIAEEKGYTEEQFHQMMLESAVQRWKDAGFTDEEIAERQNVLEERHQNCVGGGSFRGSPFRD